MTLKEAKQKIRDNRHLIGRFIGENEITHIIISPATGSYIPTIAYLLNVGESYESVLSGHNDFSVYVLYDLEYIRMGHPLLFEPLNKVISKIRG